MLIATALALAVVPLAPRPRIIAVARARIIEAARIDLKTARPRKPAGQRRLIEFE